MTAAIPAVTTDQMREVDRIAGEVFDILLVQMLENAGRALAELARRIPRYRAARATGVSTLAGHAAVEAAHFGTADLALDALIGYGLNGSSKGWTAALIARLNASGFPLLALDVPSGLDATSGECPGPCIRAAATLTLALPKTGLLTPNGRAASGRLYLADIGIPPVLYNLLGLSVGPVFAHETIVTL